jgi:hypothetical protein
MFENLEEQLIEAIISIEELSFFIEEMSSLPESFNLSSTSRELQS